MGTLAERISPHMLHALNSQRFMRKAQYKEQFLKISLVETDRSTSNTFLRCITRNLTIWGSYTNILSFISFPLLACADPRLPV